MIGRTIRVLEQDPRLAISIFYPSSVGDPASGIDLYAPCQAEAAAILMDMGVNLVNLNITDDLTTSDTTVVKKGIWPVVLMSPGFGVELVPSAEQSVSGNYCSYGISRNAKQIRLSAGRDARSREGCCNRTFTWRSSRPGILQDG